MYSEYASLSSLRTAPFQTRAIIGPPWSSRVLRALLLVGQTGCRPVALEVGGQARAGRVALAVHRSFLRAFAFLRVLIPRVGVLAVVELLRELRQLQRIERVAHHCELVRLVRADRLLREARLWTVRQARRMRDRTDVDASSRAELAGDVVDHLLRLQIRVVVRDRHGKRIEVELARTER